MTEKEILRGNELILNFMSKDNKHIVVPDYGGTFISDNLKELAEYDSSWDWLMMVVEKIMNMEINDKKVLVEIKSFDRKPFYSCSFFINEKLRIAGIKDEFYKKNINTEENSPIQTIWLTVVKFIKWYNKWYNKKE